MNSLSYFNGAWVPHSEVAIAPEDLGFAMGVTVVERLRTFGGTLFRSEKHMERLRRSLEIVGWDADSLCQEIAAALAGFIEHNGSLIAEGDDWAVAVFVTPGNSTAATKPILCVHGFPLPFANWADQYETGLATVIVDVRQVPENCWPSELKCRSRMHYYLADRQAEQQQPGARGIVLDQEGFIGEGTTANVVAFFADRGLVTPPRSKVLPGVTQEVLYELAEGLDIPCGEADILPEELATADEIYFVSTSICLLPVVHLDGGSVGTGKPGPMYRRLLAAWSDFVGVDIASQALQFAVRR